MATATLRIRRATKSWLRTRPSQVLVGNRLYEFYPGDDRDFLLEEGPVTIAVNKKQYLSFELKGGEVKLFEIGESYADPSFLIRYGLTALLMIAILIQLGLEVSKTGWSRALTYYTPLLLILFWILRSAPNRYFFLEEI